MTHIDENAGNSVFDDAADDTMTTEEFAEVRTALGLAVPPVTPNPEIKAALLARIAQTPQLAPTPQLAQTPQLAPLAEPAVDAPRLTAVPATTATSTREPGSAERRASARWMQRPAIVLTAAAAAVALFVGGVFAGDLLRGGAAQPDQLASIVAAPDVTTAVSELADGGTATLVASESQGLSAMVFDGLTPLESELAYQLWYITDGVPVPAGLFDVSNDGPTVQVLQGTFEAGTIVGVTVEPASGSEQPTTEPIVAIATA